MAADESSNMLKARLRSRSSTAGLTASAWSGVSAGNLSYIVVGLIIGVSTSAVCTVVNVMSSLTNSACNASRQSGCYVG